MTAAAPLTIAARPVLLRTKPGSEAEEPAAEAVQAFVTETFEETAQEATSEAAQETAQETAYPFEEGAAESVAAVETATETRADRTVVLRLASLRPRKRVPFSSSLLLAAAGKSGSDRLSY